MLRKLHLLDLQSSYEMVRNPRIGPLRRQGLPVTPLLTVGSYGHFLIYRR